MIINGNSLDVLKTIDSESVNCVVTSPPYYGLRDYGVDGQIGLEETPKEYIERLVEVFHEVKRVLRDDGTLWINIGDTFSSYSLCNMGLKPKDLIGIPWMLAFALRADGWYLRQDIIWHKPNPMPESVTDRCTKSHEYIFLLSKSKKYYFDHEAIKEDAVYKQDPRAGYGRLHYRGKREGAKGTGQENFVAIKDKRNKRDVWRVNVKPFKEAHFATFPEALIEPCILAGCEVGGTVLDPFFGSGTVGVVAVKNGRNYIGIELNKDYCKLADKRIANPEFSRGGVKT